MTLPKGSCQLLSSLAVRHFCMLIFVSETTRPIRNKLGRNDHWLILYKVYVFPNRKSTIDKMTQGVIKFLWNAAF
jgi:hypothetical protein